MKISRRKINKEFKTICLALLASTTLGVSVLNNTNVLSVQAKKLNLARIHKHYMREYKVNARKPRRVTTVKYYKHGEYMQLDM